MSTTKDLIDERYGPVIAVVESRSKPGKSYEVRYNDVSKTYSCQCTGWKFRKTCGHCDAAKEDRAKVVEGMRKQFAGVWPEMAPPVPKKYADKVAKALDDTNAGIFPTKLKKVAGTLAVEVKALCLQILYEHAFDSRDGIADVLTEKLMALIESRGVPAGQVAAAPGPAAAANILNQGPRKIMID